MAATIAKKASITAAIPSTTGSGNATVALPLVGKFNGIVSPVGPERVFGFRLSTGTPASVLGGNSDMTAPVFLKQVNKGVGVAVDTGAQSGPSAADSAAGAAAAATVVASVQQNITLPVGFTWPGL